MSEPSVDTSSPEQDGRHFADDTSKYIFLNERFLFFIKKNYDVVTKRAIDNYPSLIHVRVWHWTGAKTWPEPMVTQFTNAYKPPDLKMYRNDLFAPGQNGRHFADKTFRYEKFCILIKISLRFVPKGPIDSNPALC